MTKFKSPMRIPVRFQDQIVGQASINREGEVLCIIDPVPMGQKLADLVQDKTLDHISLDATIQPAKQQSNLVDHARRELLLINEEPETIEGYLNVIQAFADMGHSGGSASVAIPVINQLLQFKNLSPLTNNPLEWMHVGGDMWPPDGVWQNVRNGEAFSHDGGKTYYLLSEGGSDAHPEPLHKSEEIRK